MITQAPRGTKDWFGKDMDQRTYLENIFKDLCASYNIHEIITPVFEHTELFQRGVGETTDVVQKEMYTFEDKGHRSISLKPEGTAGAIRAYLQNGLANEPQPIKMFYITPAFRYEKPQSERVPFSFVYFTALSRRIVISPRIAFSSPFIEISGSILLSRLI